MYTAQDYPFDYGFVPQTLWDDGDALDVALLTTYPLFPGVLVRARPVGIMHMIDGGEADEKIIAVPTGDPRFADVKDLSDINPHTLKVQVGEFEGKEAAQAAFERACQMYSEKK
jgi:inorganic pyrophosphatase